VPAGTWRVEFAYHAPHLRLGLLVSGLALLAWLIALLCWLAVRGAHARRARGAPRTVG
jgi:hypothetical protein